MLIRHAKAADAQGPDEARSLAPRGISDAQAMGRWLAAHDIAPDLVTVSPATRARQTWDVASGSLGATPSVDLDARIYDNTVEAVLAVVTETDDSIATLALVGHNPSVHALAVRLDDGQGETSRRAALADGYPTAAIAVFDVPGSWAELASGTGLLRDFVVARG